MKLLKEHAWFVAVFSVCVLLRFLPLFEYQFTYDELSGLTRTQFDSFSEVMEKGVKIDAHPALVQLLIFYTVKLFGYKTWLVKLPFLLFSMGAVIYAHAFGLRNFSKQSGLFAASIFSFSLIFVFYAPIARMYISGVFFSVALLYYFFEIFFQSQNHFRNYFLLGLFAWLSAINQHINSLFAFTVCVSGLFFLNKNNRKPYLITCILTVLAYLPHLPVTLYQLSVPGIGRENGGWLEAPDFLVIFDFLKTLFGTGKTWLLFLALLVLAIVLNKKVVIDKRRWFLLLLFVLNYLIIYGYSVWRTPVFQYSVMLFSATALIMFVTSLLHFEKAGIFATAFFLISSALVYKTYVKKDYLHESVKTVFEYQFERTFFYKNLYGDDNVYPIFCDADDIMKKIYFDKYEARFDCVVSADSMITYMEPVKYKRQNPQTAKEEEVSTIRLFGEFVSRLDCDYVVLTSATPAFQAVVAKYFPYLIENTQTQAINFKCYSKKPEDKSRVVHDDIVHAFSSPAQPGAFYYSKINDGNRLPLTIDSLNEFPFDTKVDLASVCDREGQVILVEARFKSRSTILGLQSCISLTNRETKEAYSYTAKSAADFLPSTDSSFVIFSDLFVGTKFKEAYGKADLNCYLWNTGKEKTALLDYRIKVIDYWQKKWHFWD